MEIDQEMKFFLLAKPTAIINKDNIVTKGIASFYVVDIYENCFVFLLGHKSDIDIDRCLLSESLLTAEENLDGTQKKAIAKIGYEDSFDTDIGLFLKRNKIGDLAKFNSKPVEISDPKVGNAYIITTIDGFDPQVYSCNIKEVFDKEFENTSFKIDINDDILVQTFGGGCSGMSGSIIIQDKKLVGILSKGIGKISREGYCVSISQIVGELKNINKNKEVTEKEKEI
jgi:hypothetical protein